MQRARASVRDAFTAAALIAMLWPATAAAVVPTGCGTTTLQATVVVREDGRLGCGPGESITIRDDLKAANPARTVARAPLTSFVALADPAVVDEESPLRAEYLEKCGLLTTDAFRPHESLIPALLESHVRAVTSLASNPAGSPNIFKPYDFAVGLGSATDNRQRNELRWLIDILDGGGVLDPDSGSDGYQGVQGADPRGNGTLPTPVSGRQIRDLANEPFLTGGLRTGPARLPWFDVIGDRDVKQWGLAPADQAAFDAAMDAWATGPLKLNDLGAQHMARICDDPTVLTDPGFLQAMAADPGAARVVTADAERAPLDRSAWMGQHTTTSGVPSGHGFGRERCTDADGNALPRACYTWSQNAVRFIVLDTTPSSGIGGANIDSAQLAWLERQLRASSSRFFTTEGKQRTTNNTDRLVVVMQHHPTSTLAVRETDEAAHGGADLRALLLRYPNVVLQLSADAGRHRITAIKNEDEGTGYWEVETASVADWPSQSRSIEIADNGDGTVSIFSVMIDAAVPADARSIRWDADDPTNERARGARANTNEAWLASAAREIAYHDPQIDPATVVGTVSDRNVELLARSPFPKRAPTITIPNFPGVPVPNFPSFGLPPPSLPPFTNIPPFPGSQPQPPLVTNPTPTYQQPTGPGLAVLPSARGGWGGQALRMFGISAIGGWWLWRARVRRWMVGI